MPSFRLNGGVLIAAPASGSGKTTVALALIRLLAREGHAVAIFKSGPDYIDGAFHRAASAGRDCSHLDAYAMRRETIAGRLGAKAPLGELGTVEGAIGRFDRECALSGKRVSALAGPEGARTDNKE